MRGKADSREIADVLSNVSGELYRNFESLSLLKRSSSTLEDIKQDTPINPESVQLRQSLADFGEGIKNISNNLLRLNQARIALERKYSEVDNMKAHCINKKEVKDWITTLREEITEKVLVHANRVDEEGVGGCEVGGEGGERGGGEDEEELRGEDGGDGVAGCVANKGLSRTHQNARVRSFPAVPTRTRHRNAAS
eukprot:TRINITY_DN15071_c0_g2_i6.p1 TRINITY_DN15071_c0_g2~~TRINITY_DN15071_c0_g2_i6.p1  ORF type:complete len:195 (-),score=20.36 TRINITY_DN15071_c0_g2_i6:292-876(-)